MKVSEKCQHKAEGEIFHRYKPLLYRGKIFPDNEMITFCSHL